MSSTDLKSKIGNALHAFAEGSLATNAINLFKTLGYNTERSAPLRKPTYVEFKNTYIHEQKFDETKALVKDWKSVDLMFQISEHEIKNQLTLFETGKFDDKIYESYLFVCVELSPNNYTRTALSQITREINRLFRMPVMVVFKYDALLTLSVINRRLHKKDDNKDVLEKVTLIKDIKYNAAHRAHIEILCDLSFDFLKDKYHFTNFVELHEAWQKTLDTKELNKRFYEELFDWYLWAIKHVKFPQIRPDNADMLKDDVHQGESVIRLLTRLLFCWFLKEKNQVINDKLFDKNFLAGILKDFKGEKGKDSLYYKSILQNLFFATLSVPQKERKYIKEDLKYPNPDFGNQYVFRFQDSFINPKENLDLFKHIPFLNGGLFDCLDVVPKPSDEDRRETRLDGFSTRAGKQAVVPDFLFWGRHENIDLSQDLDNKKKANVTVNGLIDLLNKYKFTIEENTPIEEEIALDPELLGKVFENLLASYNPETKTTARKQTGSFYTPREIVNYMVDESTIAYLKTKLLEDNPVTFMPIGSNQPELFGNTVRKGQLKIESPISTNRWTGKEEALDKELHELISYSQEKPPFTEAEVQTIINAINNCKILDPACGSGAFPMGMLHKLVHILYKLDNNNERWREIQRLKALKDTEQAYQIGDLTLRNDKLKEISEAFEDNASDYGRKLYLIKNCIYGIDIQPIAIQIAKLRFFISLIVDQEIKQEVDNLGLRTLPNLDFKLVAANTLIGAPETASAPVGSLGLVTEDAFEKQFEKLASEYFGSNQPKAKKALRGKIEVLIEAKVKEKVEQVKALSKYEGDEKLSKHLAEKNKNRIADKENQIRLWKSYTHLFKYESVGFYETKYFFPEVKDGFDVVIGNPPYGVKFTTPEKAIYRITFPESQFKIDSYSLFLLKSINLLKKKGNCALIITNTFLDNYFEEKVREKIVKATSIQEINDLDDKIFDTAVVHTMIFRFAKIITKKNIVNCNYSNDLESGFTQIPQDFFLQQEKFNLSLREFDTKDIFATIKKGSLNFNEIISLRQAIKTGDDNIYIKSSAIKKNYRPILRGKDIKKWTITAPDLYVDYGSHLACPRDYRIFEQPKILIREAGSFVTASFDDNNYYIMSSLYNGILINKRFEIKYILSLLNSSLFQFLMNKMAFEKTKGAFTKAKIFHYEKLPVKDVSILQQMPFLKLVNQILSAKEANPKADTSQLEHQIDVMVYHLYNLSYAEAKIIDPELSTEDFERYKLSEL